jgi:hypothetical protein
MFLLAGLCQARLLGTNNFLFRNLFNRWLPSTKYDLKLVEVSSISDIGYQTVFPLQNGDILPVSSMSTVTDVTIAERKSSLFMKGLSMKYEFYTDSTTTQPETQSAAYDDVKPYTLMGGSIDNIPNLQRIGTHKLTISAKSLFGRQIRSQTISWDVFDDSASTSEVSSSSAGVLGELQQWHKITLVFKYGPTISESASPNPFTDYRLDVVFRNSNNSDLVMTVPGYYAADGNAAQTSATAGRVWHCHFAPPAIGFWTWKASFITAPNVAMANPGAVAGSTVSPIHGASGSFNILPTNKTEIDLRSKGLLQHIEGKHHLQFIGSGEWFLKTGADSPENFLAYNDFDNTPNNGGLRKSWTPHVIDYNTGDPSWKGDKGKGMIGAINYLSAQGMRSFSFLTMNIDGDDKNVYPYVDSSDRLRLDVSKLAQWEIIFEHSTTKGMFLHFKTQERENDQLLDGGELANERKLYYRELIARFGHHLALNWNLGEENSNTDVQLKQFTDWFKTLDPYNHPVVVHNWPTEQALLYGPLYGYPRFDGASLQTDPANVFQDTLDRINDSDAAGHPWVVSNDEQGSGNTGVVPDSADSNHNVIRRNVLWGNIMVRSHFIAHKSVQQFQINVIKLTVNVKSCSFT